jgi:putative SOS response-associated peptidase YedK
MCYSAQIKADYAKFVRHWGPVIDIHEFFEAYWRRLQDPKARIPRAVDALFAQPQTDEARRVREVIDEFDAAEAGRQQQELFAQRRRLADAERKLADKPTKAASDSKRIASDKIERALGRLAALRRTEANEEDARFFPGWWVPVMVNEGGRRVVKPMRYQCRPAGKPAAYDSKFPGTYNARRDNLTGFWRGQFGHTHGLICANAFFENVTGADGRNVVLEFRPQPAQDMLIACLWSNWTGPEGELLSFAAITDEPPPEVAAARHDRCIIPIKPEHVDAWLDPRGDLSAMQAILDDRERPFYEHRLAA